MEGISLQSLTEDLHKVPAEYDKEPARTVPFPHFDKWNRYHRRFVGRPFDLITDYRDLPIEVFNLFTFDEQCKLVYTKYPFSSTVETLFRSDPTRVLFYKIHNSMWRWGGIDYVWNEVVDAWNHLRRFHFSDNADFNVRIDHASFHNQYGYSTYHRVYVDGAFAYFVYYKGEHVLTIGFSIMGQSKILIQQVQAAAKKGNRALYKLPQNRLEFVIQLFRQNFPGYKLSLVTGESLADKSITHYSESLTQKTRSCERLRASLARKGGKFEERLLATQEEDCAELTKRIAHLQDDKARIVAMYNDTGSFKIGDVTHKGYQLTHRAII